MNTTLRFLAASVLTSTFLVGGCAVTAGTTRSVDISQIKIGDSKQQVLDYLGTPSTSEFYKRLNEESWTYYRLASFDENLVLGFKNGNKVTSINRVPVVKSFSFFDD